MTENRQLATGFRDQVKDFIRVSLRREALKEFGDCRARIEVDSYEDAV